MENIITEIREKSAEKREEVGQIEEIKKVEVEIQEEAKAPAYTIMTKKVRQKKVAAKEQENAFQEMIQSGKSIKDTYKLGLPGNLGKFISETLKETINEKHPLDLEAEGKREELIKKRETGFPQIPEILELEQIPAPPEELKEMYFNVKI